MEQTPIKTHNNEITFHNKDLCLSNVSNYLAFFHISYSMYSYKHLFYNLIYTFFYFILLSDFKAKTPCDTA